MASAEPEQWKRAAAYRMHGERVDGNDLLAVLEASDRLLRRAREERAPALLETTTYRFRGHSVADAGKVYRAAEEVAEARKHDPIDRFVAQQGDRRRGGQRASAARSTRRSTRRSARPPPIRRPIRPTSSTTSTATRAGASSSRRWRAAARSASGRGRVHGGRDLPRGAAARARRGARARRARLPHGRGDRPLRGLLQGHGGPLREVRRRGACARRRSPRRASSAPASARRCSACGPSSRS